MERVGLAARPSAEPQRSALELHGAGAALPRIVAYGDSLTAGFPSCVSFGETLSAALAEAGQPAELHICGMCGLTAEEMLGGANEPVLPDRIGRMGVGLADMVRERQRGGEKWRTADLALIMAGTNDLAGPTPGERIAKDVQELHKLCHSQGVRTVVLSIPDAGIRKYKRLKASGRVVEERDVLKEIALERTHDDEQRNKATRRKRANGLLAKWARGQGASAPAPEPTEQPVASVDAYLKALDMADEEGEEEAVPSLEALLAKVDEDEAKEELEGPELFVSMASVLPFGPRSVAAGHWESDTVHFTAEGSRVIGRRLAALLLPLVERLAASRLLAGAGAATDGAVEDGTSAPSLEAFMAAFDLEEELRSSGKAKLLEEVPAKTHPWEEEAAVTLQRFVRGRKRR